MSSSPEPAPRRRHRSNIEDEDDGDSIRSSQRSSVNRFSTHTKRAKTNLFDSDSEVESHAADSPRFDEDEEGSESDREGQSEYQPGSIRRVKVHNFVTYEKAEFFPGPNLNMVIGPNGTGKSSLVCAICLGLGLGPQHLGRAGEVGEFVKHGMDEAEIEIELEKRPRDPRNYVVRVRIIRDGNKRDWYLDGKKTSLKSIQNLTKELSIQIDNLCQFLPQDKVSEFAALSPVDLLLQTQRAAAPEIMLEQHEELKLKRKEQKTLQQTQATDTELLESMENRQQNLHAEVQRLQERQDIIHKVKILKMKIPFVEYKIAREQHIEFKKKKKDAHDRLTRLNARVEPLLADVMGKKNQEAQIKTVVSQREQLLRTAEQDANILVQRMQAIDEEIQEKETACDVHRSGDDARKKVLLKINQTITRLEARLKEPRIEFDSADYNKRIGNISREIREINEQVSSARAEYEEHHKTALEKRAEKAAIEDELRAFESAEGQQVSKLESFCKQSATAWQWIKANRHQFEKEIYGPPIITCSVKDPRYVDQIEALFQQTDFRCFVAQTSQDWDKVSKIFVDELKLADVTVKECKDKLSDFPRPNMTAAEMKQRNFEHWALDLIDGPEPVLAVLCSSTKIFQTALGLKDMSEAQHSAVVKEGIINSWVTGNTRANVVRRREYGDSAVSVVTKMVGPAKIWTNRPVDVSKREEIRAKIDAIDAWVKDMSSHTIGPLRKKQDSLKAELKTKEEEKKTLEEEKRELQKKHAELESIPGKIATEQENLAEKKAEGIESRKKLQIRYDEHDELVLQKARLALDHHHVVTRIRLCHESLVEAKIRLIETRSDIESLNARNADITAQVAREEELVRIADSESRRVREVANRALNVCEEIRSDPEMEPFLGDLADHGNVTVESLELDIAAEESKLEFIQANNPNAIRDYEARARELNKLKDRMANMAERLEQLEVQITDIRNEWEPELDKLISKISEAFAFNFEQIGCAGEVSVHKDEDFELWAIQIKVRFRENESLQILDAHRQSGGERSVSTIFYLMSLQSMARAPFRVVDEINQGMDPRNERMVHERMVEIACKEHTSQYFLITPKLLTGLRYDKRMKVLCIASGEHMPENYKNLDVAKIIGIQRAVMAAG